MSFLGSTDKTRPGWASSALWLSLAVLSCFYVTLLNGGPLYYFDSFGYLESGVKVLRLIGVIPSDAMPGLHGGGGEGDGVINGSRSVVYSVLAAASTYFLGVMALPLLHLLIVLSVVLFLTRILMRSLGPVTTPNAVLRVAALSLLAAGLSSLPFFVAYFMPDILAGLLILSVAVLTIAWPRMRLWEILVTLLIGIFAVLSHPSHLLISGLLVPLATIAGVWVSRRRWWVPGLLVALMTLAGVSERMVFTGVAQQQLDAEVTYYPFLTARLIQDGVGYAYLEENCPNREIATCAVHNALGRSDNPARFTASHIIFEFTGDLASFQLLHPDMKQRVAAEQIRFALRVGLSRPVGTAYVILKNTFRQARMNSIRMTVPEIGVSNRMEKASFFDPAMFHIGWLSEDRGWIKAVDRLQNIYYALALLGLVALLIWPGRLKPEVRVLALLVLAGILANAFVCGAVSQPAHRYGSRVIWLLPFVTMLAFLLPSPRRAAP